MIDRSNPVSSPLHDVIASLSPQARERYFRDRAFLDELLGPRNAGGGMKKKPVKTETTQAKT
jgi:hypothetical protein